MGQGVPDEGRIVIDRNRVSGGGSPILAQEMPAALVEAAARRRGFIR
jgi:hypothetical protein